MVAAIPFVIFILSFTSQCQGKGEIDGVVCPDGTECKNEQTCCEIGEKRYGCCLLPNAVCCVDRAHCCPERSVCDLKRQRCIPELLLRNKAQQSHSSLGDSTTVHKNFDKLMYLIYNRNENVQTEKCVGCPIPNGICCADGRHCCPSNMTCEATSNTCIEKEELTNTILLTETAAYEIVFDNSLSWSEIKTESTDNICPGGKKRCKDNDTCCKSSTGDYACCPLPNATCCSDGQHCCPNGMKCDVAHSRCTELESLTSLSNKIPTEKGVCPDRKTKCTDESTCCQLPSGSYGCCPYENATCCTDKLHCCPSGYQCDLAKLACIKGDISFISGRILPGETVKVESVVCPGGHFKCPDNTTCCQLPDGRYGCCPYPRAVCCSDKQHCCPESTKCDIEHQRCIKQLFNKAIQPWFDIPFARVLLAETN